MSDAVSEDPSANRFPVTFIRRIGIALIKTIYRIRVVNAERVPEEGGALLLPNHVTFADAFFISAACPRPVRFVMDEAFMARRSIRLFVRLFQTVTIRREQPMEAIRITIAALKKGDLVCLFPEGQLTRTGTLSELRRGFELIAKKAGHPLIPMWCDGSWGSIFSFERGRFFRKFPYHVPFGLTVAFGRQMVPANGKMELVRQAMMVVAAEAMAHRFQVSSWSARIPRGRKKLVAPFRAAGEFTRRRLWINGHQIGQINAIQRKKPFHALASDPLVYELPGLFLTFSELFDSKLEIHEMIDGTKPGSWVGSDHFREELRLTQVTADLVFYDFGERALQPVDRAEVLHCTCLAIGGNVIAMSMPDPPKPTADSEFQAGRKARSWGKLLPGWFLIPTDKGGFTADGPAAPKDGIQLPAGSFLDEEGFLMAERPREE